MSGCLGCAEHPLLTIEKTECLIIEDSPLASTARLGEWHLHIPLTRTDPDITNNHIVDLDPVVSVHYQISPLKGGWQRAQRDPPTTRLIGTGLSVASEATDGNTLSRSGSPPDGKRHLLLEDHVIPKDGGHGHLGPDLDDSDDRRSPEQEADAKDRKESVHWKM
jgi:hypothetical protein